MPNTHQVTVHNVHRCEQRLSTVLLRVVEGDDLLHSVGAVIYCYNPSNLFLGNFLVFKTFEKILEGRVDLFIKIVE